MAQVGVISPLPCPLGPEYLDYPDELPISSMSKMTELAEYPDEGMNTLLPCITCNRTFNPVALERHRKVCEKLSAKSLQVFDSNKKRTGDLDVPRGSPGRELEPPPKFKSRWREKRAEFLRVIRAAKHDPEDDGNDENSRRNSIPSDYVQCPHCTRHFGPKSADRHIDWCREQRNRLPKNMTQQETIAVAKMKARTKYMPPRPGQSGWKAPKKKDVISSIPPQNSGHNVIHTGRILTPPTPNHRQISPPPMSPSRKASSSSLPPGPPRYGTSSLGRSSGKQFAAMLQAVTGTPTGYGLSSGYGPSSLYGTASPVNSGYSQTPFQRTSSLRIPRKKYGTQKMARHRDLASDMLASVMGGGGKRGEPEGDEAGSPHRSYERGSHRLEDKPYDPFSAAELQFQSLLAPTKGQRRKASGLMGSTGSLKHVGLSSGSPERDFGFRHYNSPKPRSTSLSVGNHTLSLLGLNSYGMPMSVGGYPEKDFRENSPIELASPDDNLDILSRLSSSKSPNFSPNRSPYGLSPSRSPSRFSPNRSSPVRIMNHSREKSPYKSSRGQSLEPFSELILSLEETAGSRKPADGANLNKISPMNRKNYSKKKSHGETISPINQQLDNKSHGYNGNSSYGWINTPDYESPKNLSSYFARDNLKDRTSADGMHSSLSSAAYDSLKAIRESFADDPHKKDYIGLDDQQRTSSGSSTDSSFPPASSPMSSSSPSDKNHVISQITRFCHECGHKYPVDQAKFCCQCGIRRINV